MTKRKTETNIWEGRNLTGSIEKFFGDISGPTTSTDTDMQAAYRYLTKHDALDIAHTLGIGETNDHL